MMRRMLFLIAGLILSLISISEVRAQTNGTPIVGIDVAGVRTVGARQIKSWADLEEGQIYSEIAVAEAIRSLFATGKFSDIFVYRQDQADGVRLILNLTEFPRIRQISYRDNKKINDDDLNEALELSIGQFANPAVVKRELAPLRELYYEKGYYNMSAHVDSSRIDGNNMQHLIITINEGSKVKARTISFTGNNVFTTKQLLKTMKQSTGGFPFKSATFKKKQFEEDKQRILSFYRDNGYLDAELLDVDMEFVEEREKVDLTLHLKEGPLYHVGMINWSDNEAFDDLEIADLILLRKGDVFRESDYMETMQTLHSLYWDSGYIYVTVEPQRDIKDGKVDVSFVFHEGQVAEIRAVQVEDNLKTYDNVILREMRLLPGDVFNKTRLDLSQRNIFQLGFFEDVQVDYGEADIPGDIDLTLRVKEKQTGQFSFGMAYSEQTSATGFIQVAETNFLGKGQNLGIAWQFGSRQRYVDLNFTEPWFRGTPMLLGVDVFDRYQYRYDDFYESRIKGGALRLGRRIPNTRYSRIGLRYELSQTRLSQFSASYVNYLDNLAEQIGNNNLPFERLDEVDWPRDKSALTVSMSRNSTDNPFFPTSGSRTTYSVELSGGAFGGEIDYQKHILKHAYYQKLPVGFALKLSTSMGLIYGLGDRDYVPDYEKFRLGGNRIISLRGYRDLEVVPRGNPGFIGGRFYGTMSTEILFPLTKAVQLLAFIDQGDTWNSFGEADFTNLRKGAGFGTRVEVPMMGTIGFDFAYGFDRIGGPSWEPHFNFGSMF